jgi:spore germination protein YaaH
MRALRLALTALLAVAACAPTAEPSGTTMTPSTTSLSPTSTSSVAELPTTTIEEPDDRCEVTLPDGSTTTVGLVWQSQGNSAEYLEQLDGAGGEVSVVSPLWWWMRADGTVVGSPDPAYVEAVHDRNIAVWPAIVGLDADAHHLAFSDPARRTALAFQISEEVRATGADGINIDIEGYRAEDAANFLAWVEELSGLVRDWGGVVSYDLIPRSDRWDVSPAEISFWSTAPLRSELSAATDCTVLMAYDQHNRFRPSGPVASPGWVEEVLVYALGHVDPAKLVLGMPFYALVWDPADLESPRAVGLDEIDLLITEGTASFDAVHGLARVELEDGRFLWAEDTAGLDHRLDLVEEHGLAGWAAWRFGFDHPGIWELMADR